MRAAGWFAATMTLGMLGVLAMQGASVVAAPPRCKPPSATPNYAVVEPVFKRQCAGCHDSRKAKNPAAQRVFEMTSYPFATERPTTLLHDLRGMFVSRGGLSEVERCNGMAWVDGGGLDANGNLPSWRR